MVDARCRSRHSSWSLTVVPPLKRVNGGGVYTRTARYVRCMEVEVKPLSDSVVQPF